MAWLIIFQRDLGLFYVAELLSDNILSEYLNICLTLFREFLHLLQSSWSMIFMASFISGVTNGEGWLHINCFYWRWEFRVDWMIWLNVSNLLFTLLPLKIDNKLFELLARPVRRFQLEFHINCQVVAYCCIYCCTGELGETKITSNRDWVEFVIHVGEMISFSVEKRSNTLYSGQFPFNPSQFKSPTVIIGLFSASAWM